MPVARVVPSSRALLALTDVLGDIITSRHGRTFSNVAAIFSGLALALAIVILSLFVTASSSSGVLGNSASMLSLAVLFEEGDEDAGLVVAVCSGVGTSEMMRWLWLLA